MRLHHLREFQAEFQVGQPDGRLVAAKLAVSQLYIQQPVVQVGRLRPFAVEEELLLRLRTQNPVLQAVFVVVQLEFLDTGKLQRFEVVAQLLLGVVPEDDPVAVEEFGQGLGDTVTHAVLQELPPPGDRPWTRYFSANPHRAVYPAVWPGEWPRQHARE